MQLDYFRGSMFEAVERMADMYPNNIAFDFMGKSTTYRKMVDLPMKSKAMFIINGLPNDLILHRLVIINMNPNNTPTIPKKDAKNISEYL